MFYEIFQLCQNIATMFLELSKNIGVVLNMEVPLIDMTILEVIAGVGFPAYVSILLVKWIGDTIPG